MHLAWNWIWIWIHISLVSISLLVKEGTLKIVSLTQCFCNTYQNRDMISAEHFRFYHHNKAMQYVLSSVWGLPSPHFSSSIAKIGMVFCPGEVLSCHAKVEEIANFVPLPPQASGATASRLNVLTCLLQEKIPVRNLFLLVPGGWHRHRSSCSLLSSGANTLSYETKRGWFKMIEIRASQKIKNIN